jgi:hypothetical protein
MPQFRHGYAPVADPVLPPGRLGRKVSDVVADNGDNAGQGSLARLFAELTGVLLGDVGATEALALLTERCPAMLAVEAAGGVVIDGGQLVITGSHETVKALLLYEMQCGHGPSWDCFHSGQALINIDLASACDRWPVYAPHALSAGVTVSTALPLRARAELVGALYFCGTADVWAVQIGQALADSAAAIVSTQRALASSERTASQLQAALTSRVVIEQAKGIIAEHRQVPIDEAFKLLRSHARDTRRSIHDLSQEVAEGRVIPGLLPRRRPASARRGRGVWER